MRLLLVRISNFPMRISNFGRIENFKLSNSFVMFTNLVAVFAVTSNVRYGIDFFFFAICDFSSTYVNAIIAVLPFLAVFMSDTRFHFSFSLKLSTFDLLWHQLLWHTNFYDHELLISGRHSALSHRFWQLSWVWLCFVSLPFFWESLIVWSLWQIFLQRCTAIALFLSAQTFERGRPLMIVSIW